MKKELELKNIKNRITKGNGTNLKLGLCQHINYFSADNDSFLNELNPVDIILSFSSFIKTKTDQDEINKYFSRYIARLGYNFSAICISDNNSGMLAIKTYDQNQEMLSFQFSLSNNYSYIVRAYLEKTRKYAKYEDVYELNCPISNEYSIIPLILQGEGLGMVIAGTPNRNRHSEEVLNTLCNYLGIMISNNNLREQLDSNNDYDNLTGFYTHKKFQEKLSQVLQDAEEKNKKISVALYDINNVSGINKEFGHFMGDEVISRFAGFLGDNLRERDIAGRYGGDEIAVIMPDTDSEEALRITKEILSKISELKIEGIGPLKASVGIATYPSSTQNREKLLLLAEQSMLISENRSGQEGKSFVVNSKDVNFWNEIALDSLSKVINKRNFHHQFNFEEELVKQLKKEDDFTKNNIEVVKSLAAAIDAKDTYTRGHSQSVSFYSELLANNIGLDPNTVERVKLAAVLHDVGKIGISEAILRKPGPLTDHEWEVMKQHPIIAVKKILEPIKSLSDLIPMIRHHHERIDGNGYPDRLKGDEIPFGAKIIAIADAFHALISNRPYRKAMGHKKAVEILRLGAGTQWDRELTEQFILILPSFHIVR